LEAILKDRGHEIVSDIEEAEAVIIDTCGFIESAKKESIDEIITFANYKKYRPFFLCVKGCLVQRYAKELSKEIPEVDSWLGVLSPHQIAEAIEKATPYLVEKPTVVYEEAPRSCNNSFAYVKIADGCDRSCTFCSIPLFKGRFKSRSIESIYSEVKRLVEIGVKEIILVAQDTTAYGVDFYNKAVLDQLLKKLNSIEGNFRIRVMYLHPDYLTDKMIDAICSLDKLLPYFDIPVQHGSDRILKQMGRIKNSEQLLELIAYIRSHNPDAAIRTSVMVGFPGETNDDFQKLLDFLEKAKFDRLGCFIYSDEEGTVSSSMKRKVSERIARERYENLLIFQSQIAYERLKRFVGKNLNVLIEQENELFYVARSHLDAPEVDGEVTVKKTREIDIPGYYTVRITDSDEYDLKGELI